MTPSINAHLEAVKNHLIAANIPCGRGRPPDGHGPSESWVGAPGQSAFNAYAFVSRIGNRSVRSFTLDGVMDVARLIVTIQCVGANDEQAEVLLDQVRAAVYDVPIAVPGRTLIAKRPQVDTDTTPSTDFGVNPPLSYTALRFILMTDPA